MGLTRCVRCVTVPTLAMSNAATADQSCFEVNCVEVKLSCFREGVSGNKMRLVAGLLGLVTLAAAQYSYR